jgi:3,4-dihydroxy 2-butanone 4-phosphate synthase / GTP cyclohydrolase II
MKIENLTLMKIFLGETDMYKKYISPVEDLIKDLKQGKMIILVDDEDRENEGDVVVAAEFANAENINFMAKHARGLICLSMDGSLIDKLGLDMMTSYNKSCFNTAFTVSIEAAKGVTTGISAQDRATTIKTAIKEDVKASDIVTPGHIFPLRAVEGGVLKRAGQTEGSVDYMNLAGLRKGAVICEIMNDDGTMARLPNLVEFSKKHNIKIGTIADLINYRLSNETFIKEEIRVKMPTKFGDFDLVAFSNVLNNDVNIALVKGKIEKDAPTLVRVHSECFTGDILSSLKCDCQDQLYESMKMIEKEGRGVIVYMRQEGRGIGLINKLKAYKLQEEGMDTVQANCALGFKADLRDYGVGAQILSHLGLKKIKLISNNPSKRAGLAGYGLKIVENISINIKPNSHNIRYLKTKKEKMGHLLDL